MRRRTFLEVISAGAAGVVTGGLSELVAAAASTSKSGKTFLLGGDLLVNRLGFGAMRLTGEGIWGWPPDRENANKVLRRAVELGVNFIDTADAYGPETNELLIAEALYPYPKGLVIATKGGNTRPGPGQWVPDGRSEYLAQCVDKSLKRLKLERIDLYQLHRIDRKVPVEESLGALKAAQDAGKIRHVGLSEVTVAEIEQAKKVLPIVSIQNQYNITDRDSEAALNYCEKEKMGFIPWAPIGGSRNPSLRNTGNALEAEAKRHNVQRSATCARLVAAKITGDVADPGHIVARASRGEHGRRETSAQRGGVEADRRASAILTTHQSIGMDQRTSW
jgi:aryl-alcohol dehydrogenase-like predicted oxidoreductase